MLAAHVVEHAVEKDADSSRSAGSDELVEVSARPEPLVNREPVQGVVAVGGRGKDRTKEQSVQAKVLHVIEPGQQGAKPTICRRSAMLLAHFHARKTERIDLPPHHVLSPRGHLYSLLRDIH